MRRIVILGLLSLLLLGAVPAGGAAAQTGPDDTTTTAVPAAEDGGTSPWVLVLIGVGLGALVGVPSGLYRRRRAERKAGR